MLTPYLGELDVTPVFIYSPFPLSVSVLSQPTLPIIIIKTHLVSSLWSEGKEGNNMTKLTRPLLHFPAVKPSRDRCFIHHS